MNSKRFVSVAVGLVVIAGASGWAGASRIKSPAQVAAETAAPKASLITVPVQKLTLSADVITRGTVRHRAPLAVNLASSAWKPAAGGVVTLAPEKGAQLDEGKAALAVGGRPVFVLVGAVPAFRDLTIGTSGEDVRQLEEALKRLGFDPGPVDGVYDAATSTAVAAWYSKQGWIPFGPTDQQRQALASAKDNAAKAQQSRVQADLSVAQAKLQLDADRISMAATSATAAARVLTTAAAVVTVRRNVDAAKSTAEHDLAAANADLANKTSMLHADEASRASALALVQNPPTGSTPADLVVLKATYDRAVEVASVAAADVIAAQSGLQTTKVLSANAIQQAQDDVTVAEQDNANAAAEADRAHVAADRAGKRAASPPPELSLLQQSASLATQDEATAMAEFARLAGKTGVQVPADEILFFPDLPRRVDDVKVKRGDPLIADLMTVSGLALSIDGSLSSNDAKLINVGAKVVVEDLDLKIAVNGVVSVRADQPGTKGVDPQKFYIEFTPDNAPGSLVGASVKITIPVKSTAGDVLAVPLSALTVGVSGTSRVEVVTGATTHFVEVTPGLAAQGLVEVTAKNGALQAGDNVVVGRGKEAPVVAAPGQTTNPPAGPDTTPSTPSTPGGSATSGAPSSSTSVAGG